MAGKTDGFWSPDVALARERFGTRIAPGAKKPRMVDFAGHGGELAFVPRPSTGSGMMSSVPKPSQFRVPPSHLSFIIVCFVLCCRTSVSVSRGVQAQVPETQVSD